MKSSSVFILVPLVLLFLACGKTGEQKEVIDATPASKSFVSEGDSMLYGLACDGCSDTVLVFLPDSGGDPVEYGIVEAMRARKVFGRPKTGDRMAVLVNPENPNSLLMAVNMEQVMGTWFYYQLPELRHRLSAEEEKEREREMDSEQLQRRDSFLNTLMVPREYVYSLKRDYTVTTLGGPPRTSSLDGVLPVVYPPIKRYSEWHLHNGKIIFTMAPLHFAGETDTTKLVNDTAEFVYLRRDSMALQFNDHIQRFMLIPDSVKIETLRERLNK